jgi:nitroimidazol reductase NimA-like FMN-containing flavoprotein (pyridoxamine 5'-phosphate oxidase superfamily)
MEGTAIGILDGRRIMALSTVRPDGWPQTTIVGYANIGLLLYFAISRSSQKFANLQRDNRASIAVGEEPSEVNLLQAVYSSAHVEEAVDPTEREQAWRLLSERHPNLKEYALADQSDLALMRARCEHVSVVDFTKGFGHTEAFDATPPASAGQEVR